jgi:hypothetical protein
MYRTLCEAVEGATVEPLLHAETTASAATAPADLRKPDVFIKTLLL